MGNKRACTMAARNGTSSAGEVTANNDELAAIGHLASLMRSRGKGACRQEFEEHLVRLVAGRQQALLQRGDIAAANRHPYHGECPESEYIDLSGQGGR